MKRDLEKLRRRLSAETRGIAEQIALLPGGADALELRRRPRIPVPLLTPWLSSHWIGLVTPVDAGVARPLIEGLSTNTTVTDPSGMELFDFLPRSFDQALHEAITEQREASRHTPSP